MTNKVYIVRLEVGPVLSNIQGVYTQDTSAHKKADELNSLANTGFQSFIVEEWEVIEE